MRFPELCDIFPLPWLLGVVVDPSKTKADGPGLVQARDGTKTHFNVYPVDKNGNPISSKVNDKNEADDALSDNKYVDVSMSICFNIRVFF